MARPPPRGGQSCRRDRAALRGELVLLSAFRESGEGRAIGRRRGPVGGQPSARLREILTRQEAELRQEGIECSRSSTKEIPPRCWCGSPRNAGRTARDRQQGHEAPGARERAEDRRTSRPVRGPGREDDARHLLGRTCHSGAGPTCASSTSTPATRSRPPTTTTSAGRQALLRGPRRAHERRRGRPARGRAAPTTPATHDRHDRPRRQADAELDELCVNTIRTLAMDAVQKANSGHPGTPMALAPIAYVLYTRDHAPRARAPGLAEPRPLRAERRPRVDAALLAPVPDRVRALARRPQALPPARLARRPATRSTATRPGSRRRPARSARASATCTGLALGERMLERAPRRRRHRPPHVLRSPRDGDMQEGISGEAGLARRPPRARPPDRLLRRQPHHDRGRHRARVLRGRRQALRGLRLARPEPRRGPRARPHRAGRARRDGRRGRARR